MNLERLKEHLGCMVKKIDNKPICSYIYDLHSLKKHAQRIVDSLPDFCSVFYAVKANPDERLISVLTNIVDGFETASEGEVNKIKRLSTLPIIFGGPVKKDQEISYLADGTLRMMNIESEHDMHRINQFGREADKILPVLLRVNLKYNVSSSSHKMAGVPTQFGIEEKRIPKILGQLDLFPYLDVKGFHFHAMSNNLLADEHLTFVKMCLENTLKWKRSFSLELETVNIGGGIGINYDTPSEPFDWDVFSEGIHQMRESFHENKLRLIIELGRYMTAHCGFYVTEVMDIKKNYGEWFALVRGGTHHLRLPAAWKMSHPFSVYQVEHWRYKPLPRPKVKNELITIAGELCTPNDLLVRKEFLKDLKAGDLVIFHLVGAYGWTISHHDFLSHPRPEFQYL
ncbi:type III PLP-dependent enzyme [Bacillus sp. ISL-45]|uniref:type III PLP-dependent enzyme n=1 Tax=Bacillus sp. ISL-45 TaxID=2819128 RepID=UPI001BE87186|nr:type III PLP-dependent enzyme [Bacillus sp. ISL-45]MBT2662822.1 type III PLP-dependent enzyme [Bacillus sp. ISL-45]